MGLEDLFLNLFSCVPPGVCEEEGVSPSVKWAAGVGLGKLVWCSSSSCLALSPSYLLPLLWLSHLQTAPVLAKDLPHTQAERS